MHLHQRVPAGLSHHPKNRSLASYRRTVLSASPRHTHRQALVVQAAAAIVNTPKPQIMVNSMTGKMGQAVADATIKAGLELVPYTLCASEVAAKQKSLALNGQQIELLGPETRDEAMGSIKEKVQANPVCLKPCVCALVLTHLRWVGHLRPFTSKPSHMQSPVLPEIFSIVMEC